MINTNLLADSFVRGKTLYGDVYNSHLDKSITLTIEFDDIERDFDERFVERCKQFALSYEADAYATLLDAITQEVTDAAYEQDDYQPTSADYEALRNDLQLDHMGFEAGEEAIIVAFRSPIIFKEEKINVQLNFEKEIDEISIY